MTSHVFWGYLGPPLPTLISDVIIGRSLKRLMIFVHLLTQVKQCLTVLQQISEIEWPTLDRSIFFIKFWKKNPNGKKVLWETKNYIPKPNSEMEIIETKMKHMQYFGNVISFCPRIKKWIYLFTVSIRYRISSYRTRGYYFFISFLFKGHST